MTRREQAEEALRVSLCHHGYDDEVNLELIEEMTLGVVTEYFFVTPDGLTASVVVGSKTSKIGVTLDVVIPTARTLSVASVSKVSQSSGT